jgi:hypothetical protein
MEGGVELFLHKPVGETPRLPRLLLDTRGHTASSWSHSSPQGLSNPARELGEAVSFPKEKLGAAFGCPHAAVDCLL